MRQSVILCFSFALTGILAGCGGVTPQIEADSVDAEPVARTDRLDYRTEIRGVDDRELLDLFNKTSQLIELEGRPPASRALLVRRIDADVERFAQVLRSRGYYDGEVAYRLDDAARPAKVWMDVAPGPVYRLVAYLIGYQPRPERTEGLPLTMGDVGLEAGAPARSAAVVEAGETALRLLGQKGYPMARIASRRAAIDRDAKTMSVTLQVDPGPFARFGPVSFAGLESVEERYLRRFVRLGKGRPYDQMAVDAVAKKLRATGLFDRVRVDRADEVGPDGELPLTVSVSERKHRSIGAGVNFSSSEGFGAEAFWEHRNLLGQGESLRPSLTGTEIRQEIAVDFRKPNYKRLDQDLLSKVSVIRQETEAFDETAGSLFLGLERKFSERWRASVGGSLEHTRIIDNEGQRDFSIVGVPLSARRDDTDNLLDPSRGSRAQLVVTPFYTFGDERNPFVRAELTGSVYLSLLKNKSLVVAARAKLGSIAGVDTEEVPASKRFFAGGGGSIRGFGFQKVGPLDAAYDPLGGRSVFETGLEFRVRVTDTIGAVPFVEAGNVYDSNVPDIASTPRIGAGLGLRYFTAIGPLRLDVAFPVNRRKGVDDRYQIYVSLGQAF